MQFRFAQIVRHMFELDRIDVINGDKPISRRQEIVNRFQRHLKADGGFDMLILGSKHEFRMLRQPLLRPMPYRGR